MNLRKLHTVSKSKHLDTPNVDIDFKNRYLMTGSIEVNQIDYDTYATRRVIINGVKLQMETTGAILDLSWGGNSRMRLKGLAGKTIQDIFETPFTGGKFRLQAVLNLGIMFASNKNGISLVDNESLLSVGASLNIVSTRLKFSLENTKNEVSVFNSKGTVTTTTSESTDSLLN